MALARDLGDLVAQRRWRLIYGGGRRGLMGAAADAALEAGAEVEGVIPQHLVDREVAHQGLTRLHITETMQQRQFKMSQLADAFVVLPGGLGTLAEFFEIVTWKQIALHNKPIALLKDGLIDMVDRVRTRKAAIERVLEIGKEAVGDSPVYIGVMHARDLASGQALLEEAKKNFNVQESFLTDLSVSLAVNFGPGTVGLVLYPAE